MIPPWKERPRGGWEHPGGDPLGPPRRSWRVLAERNPSVVPVGAWVESAPGGPEESPAFASALAVEEELEERQRAKAASLRRFQGEVQRRVAQQARVRRKLQLQKSYEAAERESCVAVQCLHSALPLAPKGSTCLFRSHPAPVIRGPAAHAAAARCQGVQSQAFQQQAAQLSKAMKQVRLKLASCKTVAQGAGPAGLPGGVWRREKPESCETSTVPAEDEGEELLLVGHHDLPAELQDQGTTPHQAEQDDDFYIKIEFDKFCDGSVKDSSSSELLPSVRANCRAPLGLWAGVDQEETKKQRQAEHLRHRRLVMNMERQQVREQQRQRRIARIKNKKENQRRVEEQKLQEVVEQQEPSLGEGASETLAQLKLEERKVKEKQRNKECARYIEALRAQIREKIKLFNIDLPPLCSCGADFWDSHPDTCANNCVFYKNHRAYSRALQSLVSSCDPTDVTLSVKRPLRDLAALYARPGKRP